MIEIQNLTKSYKTKGVTINALTDISLTIGDGEIFGVIGLSGAGKSTLVRCINLLELPTSGKVLVDGKSLTDLKKAELLKMRQSIGMIFQRFNLFQQRTVLKNICYPLKIAGKSKKEALTRAEELLELVGLSDKRHAYPAALSGGQQQRVAIARALATNPRYILCDEATSALDPATTASILDLLKEINRRLGITIIIITHEMEVVQKICHRAAILHDSRVAECGPVEQLFISPKTTIARELIFPRDMTALTGNTLRIVFNGEAAGTPVIAQLVTDCALPVNILFADTKNIEEKAYGHMVVQLPDKDAVNRAQAYLTDRKILCIRGET